VKSVVDKIQLRKDFPSVLLVFPVSVVPPAQALIFHSSVIEAIQCQQLTASSSKTLPYSYDHLFFAQKKINLNASYDVVSLAFGLPWTIS
jgi:hypothetical protein